MDWYEGRLKIINRPVVSGVFSIDYDRDVIHAKLDGKGTYSTFGASRLEWLKIIDTLYDDHSVVRVVSSFKNSLYIFHQVGTILFLEKRSKKIPADLSTKSYNLKSYFYLYKEGEEVLIGSKFYWMYLKDKRKELIKVCGCKLGRSGKSIGEINTLIFRYNLIDNPDYYDKYLNFMLWRIN